MRVKTEIATVSGLFWDRNMPPIVQRVRRSAVPGTALHILHRFAGLKAVKIQDADGTAFYNAAGEHLFTVPPQKGE